MRIIQLITKRQRRGAEVFAGQISDGLTRHGHRVQLVSLYEPPADRLAPKHATASDLHGAPRSPVSISLVRRLARFLDHAQPDLIQANGSDTLKYSVLARWLSRGRWPLVYRNISMTSDWLHLPLQRFWTAGLLHAADHVVAVSERSRQDLIDVFWLPGSRVTTIPIGTEVEPVYPTDESRARLAVLGKASPGDPLLLHVGNYTPEKNHIWMLQVFARIRQNVPNAHLFLVGDGPLRSEVERQIIQDGLIGSVHVLGTRRDVPRLMAGADLLLLPSRIEGIPGVILEASAQGTPAVATDVGGIHEAVEDGVTGHLVPLGDMAAFYSAIVYLLDNPGERVQMGHSARDLIIEHYDLRKILHSFEQLYTCVVNGRPYRPQRSSA